MRQRRSDFDRGYMDVLMNLTMCVMVLFVAAVTMIAIRVTTEGNIMKDADYVIEVEWPGNVDCDIDTWVQDPTGEILYFGADDVPLMNLDRDDLGSVTDTLFNAEGVAIKVSENKEVATLRGTIPGEYIINVHAYACRYDAIRLDLGAQLPTPVPIEVQVIKINPRYEKMFTRKLELSQIWQEKTVVTFEMSDKKNAFGLKTDAEFPMVSKKLQK